MLPSIFGLKTISRSRRQQVSLKKAHLISCIYLPIVPFAKCSKLIMILSICFLYNSKVVNFDHGMFIRLAAGGNGCGSVGRAVASNTRGVQFEFSHRPNLYWTYIYCQVALKRRKRREKRPGMPIFLKKKIDCWLQHLVMLFLHFFLLGLQLDQAFVGRLHQEVSLHGPVLVLDSQRGLSRKSKLDTSPSGAWFKQNHVWLKIKTIGAAVAVASDTFYPPIYHQGSFRLVANLLRPATVAVCCSKNRKISNYLQQPSPLQ